MFFPENGSQTVAGATLLRISQHISLNTEVCGNVIRNVIFIDTQVYSSHRHFRLVSSAKFVDVGQRHFRYIVPKDNGYVTEKVTLEVFFKTLPSYYDDVPRESMMILKWNYHQYQKGRGFVTVVCALAMVLVKFLVLSPYLFRISLGRLRSHLIVANEKPYV